MSKNFDSPSERDFCGYTATTNKENQSVEDGRRLRAALLSGGAALERMSHVENQSELGVEEMDESDPFEQWCAKFGVQPWAQPIARNAWRAALQSQLPSPPVEPRWCGGEFVESSDGSCPNCDAPRERHTTAVERTQDEPKLSPSLEWAAAVSSKFELLTTEPTAAGSEEPKHKCKDCGFGIDRFGAHDRSDPNFFRAEAEKRPCWNKGWANLAAPVASQAPAPKRPVSRKIIPYGSEFHSNVFDVHPTEAYMDYLEGRVRSAAEIIEQYPPMVRNILGGKAVRNVSELEAAAKSWLEANHDRT